MTHFWGFFQTNKCCVSFQEKLLGRKMLFCSCEIRPDKLVEKLSDIHGLEQEYEIWAIGKFWGDVFVTLIMVFYNWSINCCELAELVPDICKFFLSFTQKTFERTHTILKNLFFHQKKNCEITKDGKTISQKGFNNKRKEYCSIFSVSEIKIETCLVMHHIPYASQECFLTLCIMPCGRWTYSLLLWPLKFTAFSLATHFQPFFWSGN